MSSNRKNDAALNIRMPSELLAELHEFSEATGIAETELVRRLVMATLKTWKENGEFALPVSVIRERDLLALKEAAARAGGNVATGDGPVAQNSGSGTVTQNNRLRD